MKQTLSTLSSWEKMNKHESIRLIEEGILAKYNIESIFVETKKEFLRNRILNFLNDSFYEFLLEYMESNNIPDFVNELQKINSLYLTEDSPVRIIAESHQVNRLLPDFMNSRYSYQDITSKIDIKDYVNKKNFDTNFSLRELSINIEKFKTFRGLLENIPEKKYRSSYELRKFFLSDYFINKYEKAYYDKFGKMFEMYSQIQQIMNNISNVLPEDYIQEELVIITQKYLDSLNIDYNVNETPEYISNMIIAKSKQ